jgi:acetyltransferase-like isoleucine patch superfamily enzyme
MKLLIKKAIQRWRIYRDPVGYARSIGVQVGNDCRLLCITPTTFGSDPYLIKIGNHVTIAAGVRFITHDGGVWVFRHRQPEIDVVAPIVVGNNVFVATNALLMPGVTIGDNCVVAAGAVVTRDIPSGHVAAGVPARCIKTLEEYWQKVSTSPNAFHLRSRPLEEKRRLWVEHFFGEARRAARPGISRCSVAAETTGPCSLA